MAQPKPPVSRYRKNFTLIAVFIVLLTVAMANALFLGYRLTQKFIENKFTGYKTEALDLAIKPYNEFVFNAIPQISLYQGFIDSVSISTYSKNLFATYPFVDSILFYDVQMSNHLINDGFRSDHFSVEVKSIYKLDRYSPIESVFLQGKKGEFTVNFAAEFSKTVLKFVSHVASRDTTLNFSDDQIFNLFYTFNKNSISFLNVPRASEMDIYRDLMYRNQAPSALYDQDVLSFTLNPYKLTLKNPDPELYENLLIKPITFDSLSTDKEYFTTGIALPGAFADYQIYFYSSKKFIDARILALFAPVAATIVVVYLLLVMCGFLIYRNLNINSKLFSLQYDFINNLTHEFKTPVSVIKIAGSNIRNAKGMKDEELHLYGKILDEEAEKLNDLMNKLLSFTQIENRSIVLKIEPVDIEEFIQAMVDACTIKYPDFKISYSVDNISIIQTDATLLFSIFQNLIDNAYKYSNKDHKILFIRVRKVKKAAIFSFTDQGIGIPPAELENIFKKFYRLENEFNQNGSVGIGLAFCKEVVNFMKGDIHVKSKVGKGSEFKITLPIE